MISVLVPTYNPNDYIYECLDSLISQNLSKSEYEIILILNGSTYEAKKKIEDYIKQSKISNLRLVETEIKGVSNARNMGLDIAVGNMIAFVDDDDILSDNYLSDLLYYATENAIVVSNVYGFVDDIKECKKDYITNALTRKRNNESLFQMRSFLSSSCCKLIPRSIIGNKRFNTHFKVGEDALFMASISNKIHKVNIANNAVYYRRLRTDSASRKQESLWKIFSNSCLLSWNYLLIYLSNPFSYNLLFFLTRFVAPFKRFYKNIGI